MTKPQTITITNFSGRLTRIINGDLNSGFAKFKTSYGYDPFSKPLNLTWLDTHGEIDGISDLPLAAKVRSEQGQLYVYVVGSTGNLYKIQPNSTTSATVNSIIGISSVKAAGATYNYGASMEFFNYLPGNYQQSSVLGKIFVGGDTQVNTVNTDGTSDALIGSLANYIWNINRPLVLFQGKLVFGNGNNIGIISTTNTVTSPLTTSSVYGELNPGLPPETYITDLDVTPDGNYLILTTSGNSPEHIASFNADRTQSANASNGTVYLWNGFDTAVTSAKQIPSYHTTSLQTYLDNNLFFAGDAFGSSIIDGTKKIISLPNVKPPYSNALAVNGNFLTWIAPEVRDGEGQSGEDIIVASMFYYGSLDDENPAGLYRVFRIKAPAGGLNAGNIIQAPINILTNNKYRTMNASASSVITIGNGQHYFSLSNLKPGVTLQSLLGTFSITPKTGGAPQLGVYETQTQLFSKRIDVKQIRVYAEPVVAGNAFTLEMVGSDGEVLTNGTYTYTFGDPVDASERINFNPTASTGYALGIRITNAGSTNMTIKKCEIDYDQSGK